MTQCALANHGSVELTSFPHPCVFFADLEELCGAEGSTCHAPAADSHDALLRRAQAAEDRARQSEEALSRAMDDLHKLKSVMLHPFSATSNYNYQNFHESHTFFI